MNFNTFLSVAGRVLIALVFVLAGLNKFGAIEGTQGYMQAFGVPGFLIYPTIVFEVGAGLAIIAGYQTRVVSLALAAFCLVTAAVFHSALADQTQFVLFMKNVAMAGGFFFLARFGAGELSVDSRRQAAAVS